MSQLKKRISLIMVCAIFISLLPFVTLADEAHIVYLTVENTTYSESEGAPWEGKLLDSVPVEITEGETKIDDVIISGLENASYSQTGAEYGYISEINGLGEFAGSDSSGWMITLNDWFISAGIDSFYVSGGDYINVIFTLEGYGEDIGSSLNNNDKNLAEISFSEGELSEEFSPDVYEYTLTIPSDTESVKVTPTAVNKNFQSRIYLNTEFSEGETEKYIEGEAELEGILCGLATPGEIPPELGFYKRTEEIPVQEGDVIYIACGLSYWSSMNNGELGSGAEEIPGTVYAFTIEKEDVQISIDAGVYDYTAVTYKENNSECEAAVSEDGIVYESESFFVTEGTTVLDTLKAVLEDGQIEYSVDSNGTYIRSVGRLAEMDCTSQSGWMISVNDKFLSVGANEAILEDGDVIKLHYSVEGWGTDVGNYFSGGPVITKLMLGGVTTEISSNTVYEDENDWIGTTTYYLGKYREGRKNTKIDGDGSKENPFIIPVKVSSRTDISALTAQIETSLHGEYLIIGEEEGVTNILTEVSYEDEVTFCIETLGGFIKNYYTIDVTKKAPPSGGDYTLPNEEDTEEIDEDKDVPEGKDDKPAVTVNFKDTKGHWAESYVEKLVAQNIIKGKSESNFAPDDCITRAELVTLLYRLSGTEEKYEASRFNDVKEDDWYMHTVSWAKEKNIASGIGEGEFRPNEYVNREQAAVFIIRFCEYMGYSFNHSEEMVFTDKSAFSDWSESFILKAQLYGIIDGFEDSSFAPQAITTRAQIAKMLCTILDNSIKE